MKTNLEYYRIFYYVAKLGSFTKAAEALGSNQPNVSRVINKLENDLKTKLLQRSHHGITLTPDGQRLYSHIEKAMIQIFEGEKEIARRAEPSGKVTIAVTDIAMTLFVFDVLKTFHKDYPDIMINILSMITPQATQAVQNGQADLAVVTSPSPATSLNTTTLMTFKDILITGSGQKYRARTVTQLKELENIPFIGLNTSSMTYQFLTDVFSRHHSHYATAIEVSSITQIIPFVKENFGMAFVPAPIVDEEIKKGELIEVPLKPAMPSRSIVLLTGETLSHSADYLRTALIMARSL